MKITEQYSVNDGDYTDNSPYECIQYMIEDDISKEHIIGYKLNIYKLERCIDDKTIDLMKDVLNSKCEWRFDDMGYLEEDLKDIWQKFREPEMFYDSGEYHIITEEEYNEVLKDLL
jgi:hypothetical protein